MFAHVVAIFCLVALAALVVGLIAIHRVNAATRRRGEELDERAAAVESRLAQLNPQRRRS